MKTISIKSLMKVRYNKKYSIIKQITESVSNIKRKLTDCKTVNDIKYVIENWTGISHNPDTVTCQVIQKLSSFNETEQKTIINYMDRELLYRISEDCLSNLVEEVSTAEDVNYDLLDTLEKYKLYNRINENYEKINNKLDLNRTIRNCKFNMSNNDEYRKQVLTDITESMFVNYPNVKELYRFNITLESILFAFNSAKIAVNESLILKTVSEYYVDHSSLDKSEIMNVISEMNLYSDESKQEVLAIFEEKKELSNGIFKKKNKIKDSCDAYKVSTKSVDGLKGVMTKVYARSLEECVEDCPHVFGIITGTITSLGVAYIHPVLGILSAFVQYVISKNMDIEQTDRYLDALKSEKKKVQKKIDKKETEELKKYLDKLNVCIEKVEDYKNSLKSDMDDELDDDWDDDFLEQSNVVNFALLSCISEAIENENYDDINIIHTMINENKLNTLIDEGGNLMNTVKLVKEKLKNTMTKLTTKEKAICSEIDNRFDIFVRDFQRSMSLEKRENVIKGKVAPSLTKMVKLAAAGTVGALFAPVATALTILVGYAVSKKATIKEKQYILDELKVQQKIIERKINQAEMKGDDKALEELYRLQARYEKEYKRIKYNIRLYHESGCVL
jgi:hypothetical protein